MPIPEIIAGTLPLVMSAIQSMSGNVQSGDGLSSLLANKSVMRVATGSGLSGAQWISNGLGFLGSAAQMGFQAAMSNTAYRRAVRDMEKAGLNPALMYGNGASASTPAGSAASPVAISADPVGLLNAVANLKLLQAQKENIEADTANKRQQIFESSARIDEIVSRTRQNVASLNEISANIRHLNLSSDALEIANRYLDAEKRIGLTISELSAKEIENRIDEIGAKIRLLSAQEKATLQSIAESKAKITNLLASSALSAEQKNQVIELEHQIQAQTQSIIENTSLTRKDIEFYGWNHGAEISGFGFKPGTRFIPNSKQLD